MSDFPQPPQPPQFVRRFQLHPHQYITIPLIFLIPILALLNVFGDSFASTAQENLKIDYVTRTRYKMPAPMTVEVTAAADGTLRVLFDRHYIESFSEAMFTPDAQTITGEAYIVEIPNAQAGETYVISVDLTAEEYGQHEGMVTVDSEAAAPIEARVSTFVFP